MTNMSLNLKGMELLAIQYLLDGKNSAYGYKFELVGLDKADFSGSRDEQMLDTRLVQEAEEAGNLRKVKFYVTHEDSPKRTRAIQLNFFEDGHVTSTSEVRPSEFDEIVNAISIAKSYSPYLNSLNDLLKDYIHELELDAQRKKHKKRVNHAFDELLSSELDISNDAVIESHMHKMIFANIGIHLYEIAREQEDLVFDDDSVPYFWPDKVKEFFTLYAQYNIPEVGEREYMFMASKLKQIIDEWVEKDDSETLNGAMGLLQTFIEKYDLQS
ncbi:hypothetical protein M0R89_09140 [Halorussus limi]|uniref:Uncharacterized protein n=1 Tax=Halorussus limi TaxID=2938695 RepID=A0A8U0HZ83_9EURY|nr:hypothetical protein [Halorussus limi]UPV76199.1 hypothetical protein M0R89_09140 [Halorussus limi]